MQRRNEPPRFSSRLGAKDTLIELRDYEYPNPVRVYDVATGELKEIIEYPLPYHETFNSRSVINER